MAKLVGVYHDEGPGDSPGGVGGGARRHKASCLARRQVPLTIEPGLTMIMALDDACMACGGDGVGGSATPTTGLSPANNRFSGGRVLKNGRTARDGQGGVGRRGHPEREGFLRKYEAMAKDELSAAFMVTFEDLLSVLSSEVPCVGCRRSVEALLQKLYETCDTALEPLVITDDAVVSVSRDHILAPVSLANLFCDQMVRLESSYLSSGGFSSHFKSKKNSKVGRCANHSLGIGNKKLMNLGHWLDTWECMERECQEEVVLIHFDLLRETLDRYLKKHSFCSECTNMVNKAFNLLVNDEDYPGSQGELAIEQHPDANGHHHHHGGCDGGDAHHSHAPSSSSTGNGRQSRSATTASSKCSAGDCDSSSSDTLSLSPSPPPPPSSSSSSSASSSSTRDSGCSSSTGCSSSSSSSLDKGTNTTAAAAAVSKKNSGNLYKGITACPADQHVHVECTPSFVSKLITMAEPELSGLRQGRHAKTIEIAQKEVLTCIGICLYERFQRIQQRLREGQQACDLLFLMALKSLKKSFELAFENKQGISDLEKFCLELDAEEKRKQEKAQKKRDKKSKQTAKKKQQQQQKESVEKQQLESSSNSSKKAPESRASVEKQEEASAAKSTQSTPSKCKLASKSKDSSNLSNADAKISGGGGNCEKTAGNNSGPAAGNVQTAPVVAASAAVPVPAPKNWTRIPANCKACSLESMLMANDRKGIADNERNDGSTVNGRDSANDEEEENFIPLKDIQEFRARLPVVARQREELRKTLRLKFNQLCVNGL